MARVFSVLLYTASGINGTLDLFTVPAGHTYVLRWISGYCGATLAGTTLNFRDKGTGGTFFSVTFQPFNSGSFTHEERQVFPAGSTCSLATTNFSDVRLSGYDLSP